MLDYTVTFVNGVSVVHVNFRSRKSNTGHVGIHKRRNGTFQICKGKDTLGWRATIEEAIALRDEADRRKIDGSYDVWFAAILFQRRN